MNDAAQMTEEQLRLFYERVMTAPRCRVYWQHGEIVYEHEPKGNWIRAADIDAIAKEVGGE